MFNNNEFLSLSGEFQNECLLFSFEFRSAVGYLIVFHPSDGCGIGMLSFCVVLGFLCRNWDYLKVLIVGFHDCSCEQFLFHCFISRYKLINRIDLGIGFTWSKEVSAFAEDAESVHSRFRHPALGVPGPKFCLLVCFD